MYLRLNGKYVYKQNENIIL